MITLVLCGLAFLAHSKTWVRLEDNRLTLLSGIYYRDLGVGEINEVSMVEKIPELERIHGFSAWENEKGVFKDSLYPDQKIYIFVDNLYNSKIRLVYRDSLLLFVNLSDAGETENLYTNLKEKIDQQAQLK